ncbi:MAG: polysulfide reductase NrfD [Eggerthellaceae bacterium]|nr:polysulfide reductase NrfD [Eggerthellaceae bacterium]
MMKNFIIQNKGAALIACLVCIVAGLIAWGCMIGMGLLETTDMSNIFNWGLLIAMFAFLVGFGAGCQIVSSWIVITNKEELMPYLPICQAISLGGVIGAAVAIMADLGHPWHILSMFTSPNIASPLVWDMIALTAFIVVSLVCLIAIGRRWASQRIWMWVGLVCALVLQVVEGMLFATMTSRAWWHSFIMPIDFVIVAVICGLTIMCIISAASKRQGSLEAAKEFAKLMFIFVIIHVCLSLIEVATLAFESTPGASMALSLIGSYVVLYILELGLALGAVIVLRMKIDKATKRMVIICASLVVVAMFAHRLMLLYPAMGAGTLFTQLSNEASPYWLYPTSTGFMASAKETFALTQAYIPSFAEWVSLLMPLGFAGLIAIIGSNVVDAWLDVKD